MLLEKATGIYTRSIYTDRQLLEGGFLGEKTVPKNGETLFQKSHVFEERRIPNPKGFLFLVRNPFDAAIAEWKRRHGQGHTGTAKERIFRGQNWEETGKNMLRNWKNLTQEAVEKRRTLPLHLFYYEDLKRNATFEMEIILDFIEQEDIYIVPDRDQRIRCLQEVT